MPGSRATVQEITRFQDLMAAGLPVAASAKQVGRSESWGWRMLARLNDPEKITESWKSRSEAGSQLPAPKSFAELDGGVKDLLKDFNLFRVKALAREPVEWAKIAADLCVEWLLDKSHRTYGCENEPPGSGKSTVFTHDLVVWLLCGGGIEDPEVGRALRFMLGSESKNVSTNMVRRVRNTLELRRPFYDKIRQVEAEIVLTDAFGRFKPKSSLGEEAMWQTDRFLVAQVGGRDVYEKEPSVQAASRESGFLGERVDLAVWDDLVTYRNARTQEQAEMTAEWFETEAESRVEPGGVLLLVGQRIGPLDLYQNRIKATFTDEDGFEQRYYKHVVFPAHNEETCANNGRLATSCVQWNGFDKGCLLDAKRLPVKDLLRAQARGNYRVVYQQEDTDPENVLVQMAWLEGGTDAKGFPAQGCYDPERGFKEWPLSTTLIDVAVVDPSATRWWAIEHWSLDYVTGWAYLVNGVRRRMQAGGGRDGFLDWDPHNRVHVGLMENMQFESGELGHPIRVWIVEQNAAHKYLFQTHAYETWRQRWPMVEVWPHETQKNKNDPQLGVEATLPMAYKTGIKRLPRSHGDLDALNYLRVKIHELTNYPQSRSSDTVMADWFFEMHRPQLIELGKQSEKSVAEPPADQLAPYLQRQQREVTLV